jgi:hypothetical protein
LREQKLIASCEHLHHLDCPASKTRKPHPPGRPRDPSAHTYRLQFFKDQASAGIGPGNTGKEARLYDVFRTRSTGLLR